MTSFLFSEGSSSAQSMTIIGKSKEDLYSCIHRQELALICVPCMLGCLMLGHWQSLPKAMSQSLSHLRTDTYLKLYAHLHPSLNKIPISPALLPLFSHHTYSSILSLFLLCPFSHSFSILLGHTVSIWSLSCQEHVRSSHFMDLRQKLSCTFLIFFNLTICFSAPAPRWLDAVGRVKAHDCTGVVSNFS